MANNLNINPKGDVEIRQIFQRIKVYLDGIIDATKIPFTPAGNISATNVDSALKELDAEKETAGSVQTHTEAYNHNLLNNFPGSDRTIVMVSGNALKTSAFLVDDIVNISGTQPFEFYVSETSGGSPTKKITIVGNKIVF